MYRIGICDDKKSVCATIEDIVLMYARKKNIVLETEIWYSGEKVCEYLAQGNDIDILFLDIGLYHMTGIEVAEYIRNHLENRKMQIVYISKQKSYALELFKTQPLDFLVKPITVIQIEEVLDVGIKILNKIDNKFEYHSGRDYYYVHYDEIIYFVSEGRRVKIVTHKGEKQFYGKLKEIINSLPGNFICIHKSYIINKMYVVKYSSQCVEMVRNIKLPISKVHRKNVRENLMDHEK